VCVSFGQSGGLVRRNALSLGGQRSCQLNCHVLVFRTTAGHIKPRDSSFISSQKQLNQISQDAVMVDCKGMILFAQNQR